MFTVFVICHVSVICMTRFVCPGHLFGVLVPTQLELPRHKYTSAATAAAAASSSANLREYDVAYFQVMQVTPDTAEPLAVDPGDTELVLKGGSARVLLPVGFKGYAVAAAAMAQASSQHSTVQNAINKQQQGQSMDADTKGSLSAAPRCNGANAASSSQQQQQQQAAPLIGVHSSAGYATAAGFTGVPGPLTDTWRSVAHVIAPLLHPAAQVGLLVAQCWPTSYDLTACLLACWFLLQADQATICAHQSVWHSVAQSSY